MKEEQISIFDIFKIGVGPSSSHTLGPWRAAQSYLARVNDQFGLSYIVDIEVTLYGSLAKTGKGHGTGTAVMLGLAGFDPETIDTSSIGSLIETIEQTKVLRINDVHNISFDPARNLVYAFWETKAFHPNALTFTITFLNSETFSLTYYSIGGGFIILEGEELITEVKSNQLPFPINYACDLEKWCKCESRSIAEIVLENEKAWRKEAEIRKELSRIWSVMKESIYKGCHSNGILPGGLQVQRRAALHNANLLDNAVYSNYDEWIGVIKSKGSGFKYTLDWLCCFALAVNEENASFGRVVTAPTNGAAGVIPAVMLYSLIFCDASEDQLVAFMLTAGEIGSIFKKGATISAAMGGCQAEIGVSSAMAAAGLTAVMGGGYQHCIMAAEIAMEHHLGLTCDPVGGLVQIPCIERNTMGAIKAIAASQLALQSEPHQAKVSLDNVVKTMWETALDMNTRYKETSEGGLALNIPISLSAC